MNKLTPFQGKCGGELRRVLQGFGCEPRRWEVILGRSQTYIEAEFGPIKAWIYEDGADWKGCGRDRVYEVPDYDSLDELQRTFVEEITAALSQHVA